MPSQRWRTLPAPSNISPLFLESLSELIGQTVGVASFPRLTLTVPCTSIEATDTHTGSCMDQVLFETVSDFLDYEGHTAVPVNAREVWRGE
eukprot:1157323-Pelagomonas_calceolata.AAC.9